MANIRISNKDKELLKRTNTNIARKNKVLKNYKVDKSMNLKSIEEFETRKEFNNYIKNANEFTRGSANRYRKNKYGVVTNQAMLNEIKNELQKVNKQRKEKWNDIKNLEFKSRGEETGTKIRQRQLMGDDRFNVYQPLKFDFKTIKSKNELQEKLQSFKYKQTDAYYEKRQQVLKDNIVKAINDNWGDMGKDAKAYVEGLTPKEVEEKFISEDVFHFDFIYNEKKLKSQINRFNRTFGIKEL